jgi:hypothetical protein
LSQLNRAFAAKEASGQCRITPQAVSFFNYDDSGSPFLRRLDGGGKTGPSATQYDQPRLPTVPFSHSCHDQHLQKEKAEKILTT